MRVHVAHRSQHIEVERRTLRIAGTMRFAVAAKINRQHLKARVDKLAGLIFPTLFVVLASVGENDPAVLGWEGNGGLRDCKECRQGECSGGKEETHSANVLWRTGF